MPGLRLTFAFGKIWWFSVIYVSGFRVVVSCARLLLLLFAVMSLIWWWCLLLGGGLWLWVDGLVWYRLLGLVWSVGGSVLAVALLCCLVGGWVVSRWCVLVVD